MNNKGCDNPLDSATDRKGSVETRIGAVCRERVRYICSRGGAGGKGTPPNGSALNLAQDAIPEMGGRHAERGTVDYSRGCDCR